MLDQLLATPGVEERLELRSRFGFCALHGGLEQGTAEVAAGGGERGGRNVLRGRAARRPALARAVASLRPRSIRASCHLRRPRRRRHLGARLRRAARRGRAVDDGARSAGRTASSRRLAARARPALPHYRWVDDLELIPTAAARHASRESGEPRDRRRRAARTPAAHPSGPGADFDALVSCSCSMQADAQTSL